MPDEAPSIVSPHEVPWIGAIVRSDGQQRALAERSFQAGLAITRADGTRRPIPIATTPVVIAEAELARRSVMARHLASATVKVAQWRLRSSERLGVWAALGPAERRVLEHRTNDAPELLPVMRVDCLGVPTPKALEVNATIPAMQGYSDIAAASWIEQVLPGHPNVPELVRRNGSNVEALLVALQAAHQLARGCEADRIALLCRRFDAQTTELEYIARKFQSMGIDAELVHPDQAHLQGGWLWAKGRRWPLVYRHLFVHRLDQEPHPDIEQLLTRPGSQGTLVLNPPAPHIEMKSTLARLSEALELPSWADELGLTSEELTVVAADVPWTRQWSDSQPSGMSRTGGKLDSGSAKSWQQELFDRPEQFVLKRNWSYGGRDVFFGRHSADSPEFEPARRLYPGVRDWHDLCQRAAADPRGGGFVVQRVVPVQQYPVTFATPDERVTAHATTDFSIFTSAGVDAPWSGVCRAAASDVVNIAGGGGVVPLIRQSVADEIAALYSGPLNCPD